MTAAPTDEAAPKRGGMPRNRQLAILGIAAMIALGLFFGVPALIHLFTPKPPPPPAAPPPGTFRATPQQWSTLEFATVQPLSFRMADVTDGKIALDDNLTTQVFSPYTGRVVRVIAKVGDHVSKGSPLFTVDAAEFVQAQSDLLTAAAQVRLTEAAAARQKALFAAEGAAQRDVEQSESDLATAKAALSAARNRLRVLGESAAEVSAVERGLARSGGIAPEVVVPSPIAGVVTQRSIGVGQNLGNISSNAPPAPAFTVSDLSTVWLVGNLREVDAPRAKVGDEVEVRVDALPGRVFKAKVDYVSPTVDPATRRVTVRAAIPNPGRELLPEMFATFALETGPADVALGVPKDAVILEGDTARVWVATQGRLLALRPVKIGQTSDGMVEILSGLKAGDTVVTSGSLFIDRAAKGD